MPEIIHNNYQHSHSNQGNKCTCKQKAKKYECDFNNDTKGNIDLASTNNTFKKSLSVHNSTEKNNSKVSEVYKKSLSAYNSSSSSSSSNSNSSSSSKSKKNDDPVSKEKLCTHGVNNSNDSSCNHPQSFKSLITLQSNNVDIHNLPNSISNKSSWCNEKHFVAYNDNNKNDCNINNNEPISVINPINDIVISKVEKFT